MYIRQPRIRRRASQQGAALYVALIMLLLLALIGIVGMQVATLQERMSANYRNTNLAFQRAEDLVRGEEADIDSIVSKGGVFDADIVDCATVFDPTVWARGVTAATGTSTRRLDICMPGGTSYKVGQNQAESTNNTYQITVFSRDQDSVLDSSSMTSIDTVYIP